MANLWEGKKFWPGDCHRDPTRHASPCPGDVDGGMDIAAATFAATNRSCARKALPPGRIAEFPVRWPHIAGSLLASSAPLPNRVTSPSSQPSSFRWNPRKPVLPRYHPTQDALVATVTQKRRRSVLPSTPLVDSTLLLTFLFHHWMGLSVTNRVTSCMGALSCRMKSRW
jgi:hypothetical protein